MPFGKEYLQYGLCNGAGRAREEVVFLHLSFGNFIGRDGALPAAGEAVDFTGTQGAVFGCPAGYAFAPPAEAGWVGGWFMCRHSSAVGAALPRLSTEGTGSPTAAARWWVGSLREFHRSPHRPRQLPPSRP